MLVSNLNWKFWEYQVRNMVDESDEAYLLAPACRAVCWYLETYEAARDTLQQVFEDHAFNPFRLDPQLIIGGSPPPSLGSELRALAPVGDNPQIWETSGILRALASWLDDFPGLSHAVEVCGVNLVRHWEWEQRRDDYYIRRRP